jgi:hypothetical protein
VTLDRLVHGGAIVASTLSLVAAQPPVALPEDPGEAVARLKSCTARDALVERLVQRSDVTTGVIRRASCVLASGPMEGPG